MNDDWHDVSRLLGYALFVQLNKATPVQVINRAHRYAPVWTQVLFGVPLGIQLREDLRGR